MLTFKIRSDRPVWGEQFREPAVAGRPSADGGDRQVRGIPSGCWNWFDTSIVRAYGEAALIMRAIDQVCLLYLVDKARMAVAGLSAGASMAALLVTRHLGRFKAVVMHFGIPPGTAHSTLSALGAMQRHRSTTPLAATPGTMVAHWPPLLVIHGNADTVVSPHNGQAAAQVWAHAAGARASEVRNVQRGKRYPMSVTDFKRKGSTVATLVAIDRLAHAWSGAPRASPSATGKGRMRHAWRGPSRQSSFAPSPDRVFLPSIAGLHARAS